MVFSSLTLAILLALAWVHPIFLSALVAVLVSYATATPGLLTV